MALLMNIIDRWQELEEVVVPPVKPTLPNPESNRVDALNLLSDIFNVNGSDKIVMFEKGLASFPDLQKALPSYSSSKYVGTVGEVSERVAHAYSHHKLQEKLALSAIAFNKLLVQQGYLEEQLSSSGKKFKAITMQGLKYGKNVSPKQKTTQTQPHWYDDAIIELYKKITLTT
jgi:hypothetical protein